ncbi:hypothetical protein SLEP1_g41792 [Rubroshorea leprosula]|uniref:Uncharacterized protein n=1 Tax=Rubroshorea leprosula TaxID=152421 RepID=A0AAV5L8J4_9ROSI|nr:hypothetical protein SLEP1_g41792 [Rubroshorea leprosula]
MDIQRCKKFKPLKFAKPSLILPARFLSLCPSFLKIHEK